MTMNDNLIEEGVEIRNGLIIKSIQKEDILELWQISYGPKSDLHWMSFNAPYFEEPILSWKEFSRKISLKINQPNVALIIFQNRIIGMLSAYWEDGKLQKWLEFGIVIYDSKLWGRGIGQDALSFWLKHLFETYPKIQHIGFTTWSGNQGMMRLGEKSGLKLEGQIRKVRYWQETWYDSIKYGILREELKK